MKTSRIVGIVALSLIFAASTAWTWRLHGYPKVGIDDANIFFSYAENFSSGNGITYAQNSEPVEGFTSMLWMFLCSVMFALGVNEAGVFALCFVLLVLTQVLFLAITKASSTQGDQHARISQGIYLALILSSPAYITWMTITLMDTCLWGVILAGMTFSLVSPPRSKPSALIASVPYVLAPAARPEALLVVPVFIALLWLRVRSSGRTDATRYCFFLASSFLLVTAGLTVFRIQYFGYPFPNTYYAKVSPAIVYNLREGMGYLYRFVLSSPVIGVSCLLVLVRSASWIGQVLDRVRQRSFRAALRFRISASVAVCLATLTLLVVPVITGGDHFRMFRFFQPACPLIYLAAILCAEEWLSRLASELPFLSLQWWRTHLFRGVAVGAVIASWLFVYSSDYSWYSIRRESPIAHEFRIPVEGMAVGKRMNNIFAEARPQPSIGVITAGGIARTYRGPIVDLMGLNNLIIAHHGGDRKGIKNHAAFEIDAFFKVNPDIVLFSPASWGSGFLKGLEEEPRFIHGWRYGVVSSDDSNKLFFSAFVSNTFIARLNEAVGLHFREEMIWSSNKWVGVTVAPVRKN